MRVIAYARGRRPPLFDRLKRLFAGESKAAPAVEVRKTALTHTPFDPIAALGRWIELHLEWEFAEPFVGYVYWDAHAGLSARGDRAGSADIAEAAGFTLRMPMKGPWRVLDETEVAARGLPARPTWLVHYEPQIDPDEPWRSEPTVRRHTHPSWLDDVQVVVHDGEPRRTGRQPEACWVRVTKVELLPARPVMLDPKLPKAKRADLEQRYSWDGYLFTGTLKNQPHKLTSVRDGDELRFMIADGYGLLLMVTEQYLDERKRWAIGPCTRCSAIETFDPPSVMARTRFSDVPEGSVMEAFNAKCALCGDEGTQMLSSVGAAKKG